MARIKTASQRTDLPLGALAHGALWAPVLGACAIVLAPPPDHPVLALDATTDAEPCPPKRQQEPIQDTRASVRARRPRMRVAMISKREISQRAT